MRLDRFLEQLQDCASQLGKAKDHAHEVGPRAWQKETLKGLACCNGDR